MDRYSTYAAMKSAIETHTRYQTKKLSSRKIRATTVAPGPIATNFGRGIVKKNLQFRTNAIAATALGRIGEPDDIGGLVHSFARTMLGGLPHSVLKHQEV